MEVNPTSHYPPAPPAKRDPAADVRRYFPKVATIHGSLATDANALYQLAVWLLHWAERTKGERYNLPGQLREQMAAHPHAGKFLKACGRLHEALTPLAATEQAANSLLGKEYAAHSCGNLTAVLKWWAGWIREQTEAQTDPAGAYLAALKRVPIVEEWENGSPRYTLPIHLLDMEVFSAEMTPLRQAFETALPDLAKGKKRALRHALSELLAIDRAGVQRRREQFERGEYALNFLPVDYPALRFDVAGQPGGFKWQWAAPFFWSGLRGLLNFKQAEARAAWEQLTAALGDSLPVPPKHSNTLNTPAPQPETSAPEPTLSPAERLLAPGFTLDEADQLARAVGLTDEAGGYCLGPRKLGAVVGFALALQQAGKLNGAIPALTALLAPRWGVQIATRKTTTTVAQNYCKLTTKALTRPKKTD